MSLYAWATTGIQLVCNALSLKSSKEKILETCYYVFGLLGVTMAKSIVSFRIDVNPERWNTVTLGFLNILRVRTELCWGWDFERMYPGFVVADIESEDQTKTSTKLHKATLYIKNKLW